MSGCLLKKVIQYKSREGLVVVRATAKGACQSLGCHCIRLTEGQHTLRGEGRRGRGRSGRGRGRRGVGGGEGGEEWEGSTKNEVVEWEGEGRRRG